MLETRPVNVSSVMDNESTPTLNPKTDRRYVFERMDDLEHFKTQVEYMVSRATVGVGQDWADAYCQLYKAIDKCLKIEKNLI